MPKTVHYVQPPLTGFLDCDWEDYTVSPDPERIDTFLSDARREQEGD